MSEDGINLVLLVNTRLCIPYRAAINLELRTPGFICKNQLFLSKTDFTKKSFGMSN